MEILKLGICVEDKSYGKALAQGVARETKNIVISFCEDLPSNFLEYGLVISDKDHHENNEIVLVESTEEENLENKNSCFKLFKYRESSSFITSVILIYYIITGRSVSSSLANNTKIISFLSSSGGAGITSAAISVARTLQNYYNKSTLYLSICKMNDAEKYLGKADENLMLLFLYYINKEENVPIEDFVRKEKEGMFYIPSNQFANPIYKVDSNFIDKLMNILVNYKIFNYIIIDMGNQYAEDRKRILEVSSAIFLFSREGFLKETSFSKNFENIISEYKENTKVVNVANFATYDEENFADITIPMDNSSFKIIDETIKVDLEKQYGIGIKGICKAIIE